MQPFMKTSAYHIVDAILIKEPWFYTKDHVWAIGQSLDHISALEAKVKMLETELQNERAHADAVYQRADYVQERAEQVAADATKNVEDKKILQEQIKAYQEKVRALESEREYLANDLLQEQAITTGMAQWAYDQFTDIGAHLGEAYSLAKAADAAYKKEMEQKDNLLRIAQDANGQLRDELELVNKTNEVLEAKVAQAEVDFRCFRQFQQHIKKFYADVVAASDTFYESVGKDMYLEEAMPEGDGTAVINDFPSSHRPENPCCDCNTCLSC